MTTNPSPIELRTNTVTKPTPPLPPMKMVKNRILRIVITFMLIVTPVGGAGLSLFAQEGGSAVYLPLIYQYEEPQIALATTWFSNFSLGAEPSLTKTADVTSVDATFGRATLNYTIALDYIFNTYTTADVENVKITNSGALALTVDVVDELFCDVGTNQIGAKVTDVFTQTGVTLAGGGEFIVDVNQGFDISACGNGGIASALSRVQVFAAGANTLIATQNFTPTRTLGKGPPLATNILLDVETLPADYTVDANSIVISRDGAPISPASTEANGNTFTIDLGMVSNVERTTFMLQNDVVRNAGVPCEPAVVDNAASAFASDSAQIQLTCQSPSGIGDIDHSFPLND